MMKKIGILDSGIGGLSLLREILKLNFDAKYFYISDGENVPYGNKTQEFMLQRMRIMVNALISQKVDGIVIACNTATAETIDKLREEFQIKFIGIEPYINYLNHSQSENIALILTEATFKSDRFKSLVKRVDKENKVSIFPLKSLAMLIEKLKKEPFENIRLQVIDELNFLKDSKFDTLILGCTHYPLIKNFIEEQYGVQTIDPNLKIINQVERVLKLEITSSPESTFYYSPVAENKWEHIEINNFKYL